MNNTRTSKQWQALHSFMSILHSFKSSHPHYHTAQITVPSIMCQAKLYLDRLVQTLPAFVIVQYMVGVSFKLASVPKDYLNNATRKLDYLS